MLLIGKIKVKKKTVFCGFTHMDLHPGQFLRQSVTQFLSLWSDPERRGSKKEVLIKQNFL